MDNIRFLIVTAGWNCEQYVERCLNSIKAQTYKNYKVLAIDDCSDDNTWHKITDNAVDGIMAMRHAEKRGGMFNYFLIPQAKENYDVICFVGLDDWLEPNALELTAEQYKQGKLHTYSAYKNTDGFVYTDLFYSEEIQKNRTYRSDKYRCTGFVSCTRELFMAVNLPEQCPVEETIYYNLEFSMQLLELAGSERIRVITEPIYNYNHNRPDNTANRFGRNPEVYKKIMSRPKRELYENT
jgi:glycosyltransferase involved in cell wall biosynthesis